MRVSKFLHSCVLVESGSSRILFDPGKFSFVEGLVKPAQFERLTAVLLTHGHPDHMDVSALKEILKHNPQAELATNTQTAMELAQQGVTAAVFEQSERMVGGLRVQAIAAPHAPILGAEPPQNTAYLVDGTLLNPGDSFAAELEAYAGTPVLVLPVAAPWEKELEMFAFAKRMRSRAVVPVHDGQAKDFFLDQRYETFTEQFEKIGITFANLKKPGDTFEWSAK